MAADDSSGRKQYKWTKDSSVAFVAHFGKRSGGQLRTEPVAAAQSQAEDSEPSAAAGGSSSARLNSSTLNSTLIDPVEADVPELYLVRTSDGATSGGQEAELVISVSIPLGCVERSFVLKLLCLVGTSRVHVSHSFFAVFNMFSISLHALQATHLGQHIWQETAALVAATHHPPHHDYPHTEPS